MSAQKDTNIPAWLSALGLKGGEYFIDSKPRAQRAMQSTSFSPAARIYLCLGLATMGFQQELAVKLAKGKRVPLTPSDICLATGINRTHFRRHMAELEKLGLAECRGLTKGHIEIYGWARPRKIKDEAIVTARGNNVDIQCEDGGRVSDLLLVTLKHRRIRGGFIAARSDIIDLENLAQVIKNSELSLRAITKRLRAKQPYKKKKETEINDDERPHEEQLESTLAKPESRPGVPSLVSPSPTSELLRIWLTEHASLFGLSTGPDAIVLSEMEAYIKDDAALACFKRQLLKQRPQPDSWKYFVPIAKACSDVPAKALAMDQVEKAVFPPGVAKALTARVGDGSLDSFRATTGNLDATWDDMNLAHRAVLTELGIEE